MGFFKKHPLFSVTITACLLAFAAFTALSWLSYNNLQEAQDDYERAQQQLSAAQNLDPAPSEENVQAAQDNLDSLLGALAEQIEIARGTGTRFSTADAPEKGTDMLFELEGFRQRFANAAAQVPQLFTELNSEGKPIQPMELPEGFNFGFDRYLSDGNPPPNEHVAVIYQQKEILTYLLRKLFDARPIGLMEVQREPAEVVLERHASTSATLDFDKPDARDEFIIGAASLRVPGAIDTLAFSITFKGYTQSLRPFLRALETYELPLVVRQVLVEPITGSMAPATARNNSGNQANPLEALFGGAVEAEPTEQSEQDSPTIPVVTQNISQFTVVVEFIDVNLEANAEPLAGDDALFPEANNF